MVHMGGLLATASHSSDGLFTGFDDKKRHHSGKKHERHLNRDIQYHSSGRLKPSQRMKAAGVGREGKGGMAA